MCVVDLLQILKVI